MQAFRFPKVITAALFVLCYISPIQIARPDSLSITIQESNCNQDRIDCDTLILLPRNIHETSNNFFENNGVNVLHFGEKGKVKSFRFGDLRPQEYIFRFYIANEICDPYITVTSESRVFYQNQLEPVQFFHSKLQRAQVFDGLDVLSLTLPPGNYFIQVEEPFRACSVAVAASQTPLGERFPSARTDIINRVKDNRLARIAQRAADLAIGNSLDLARLDIREASRWEAVDLKNFLSVYCSVPAQEFEGSPYTNNGIGDFDWMLDWYMSAPTSEDELRYINWARNHADYVRLLPFFLASMNRMFEDQLSPQIGGPLDRSRLKRIEVELTDLVCPQQGGKPQPRASLEEILSFLQSPRSVQYFARGRVFDQIGPDSSTSKSLVISEMVFIAIADGLGVAPARILYDFKTKSCHASGTLERWPGSIPSICLQSGFSVINISDLRPIKSSFAEQAAGPGPVNLRDALSSLIPEGAQIEWLADEPEYTRVHVSGVKGWVNADGAYWESVYAQATIIGIGNRRKLQVTVDGTVASGAGSQRPSPQNYIKSMDSLPHYKLDNFSGSLALKLREQL